MKNWKYKITTPEQLKWAVENKWPVKYKKNFGVLVKGQFESSPTHVTNAIILEKEGVPSFFSEKVSVERNGSFSVPKYLYLVPKTVEELKVGDWILSRQNVPCLVDSRDINSLRKYGTVEIPVYPDVDYSEPREATTPQMENLELSHPFIPDLPEEIFPNQENV